MKENSEIDLTIELNNCHDSNELEYMITQLRNELLELDSVESIVRPKGENKPSGAMAIDAIILNQLIVTLASTAISATISTLITLLWKRIKRSREDHTVISITKGTKKIEISTNASEDDLPVLSNTVKNWLEHTDNNSQKQ